MGASGEQQGKLTRVLVVDDHPIIRERLSEVLQRQPGLVVCGEADDRRRALELVQRARPDLMILDLSLRNSHGLDVIKDMRARHPEVLILVFSMHDEALHAERAIRAGAHGYVCKQESTAKLVEAIRIVLSGQVYLSQAMSARLASKLSSRRRLVAGIDTLTDRELLVFELLGQGRGTRQIAGYLRLQMRTVETYRARIKQKLHLKDGNELLQHAIRWAESGGVHRPGAK